MQYDMLISVFILFKKNIFFSKEVIIINRKKSLGEIFFIYFFSKFN